MSSAHEVTGNDSSVFGLELDPKWLHTIVSVTNNTPAATGEHKRVNFSYIESNIVEALGIETDLLLNQNRYPLGSFIDGNVLRPFLSNSFSSSSYRSKSSLRLRVGPNFTGTLHKDVFRSALGDYQNLFGRSNFGPSLYRGSFHRAYPFGILRSDLRRFSTPGQAPWLFPGSSTNLRSSQIFRSHSIGGYGRSSSSFGRSRSSFSSPFGRSH